MKIRLFVLLFISLFFCPLKSYGNTNITLLHTNDLHSHLLPIDEKGNDCSKGENCLGGFLRLKTFIDEERKIDPNLILLDAGDRFYGSIFFTLNKEKNLSPIFKELNYDVITLGNHEFDEDLSVLANFIKDTNTPTVCSNINFKTNDFLKKNVVPSIIINKNGNKIGVIGVTTQEAKLSLQKEEFDILDAKEKIKEQVENLSNQGVSIIILLSHLGLNVDLEIAEQISNIDVIVGGHTHNLLSNTIEPNDGKYPLFAEHEDKSKTLVITSGALSRYVGKIKLEFNDDGKILSFKGDTIALDDKIGNNKKIDELIGADLKEIQNTITEKIATINEDINFSEGKNYCSVNCPIGKFVANAILKMENVDIVFINSGSIRAPLKKGEVIYRNLFEVLPFDGVLVKIRMSGKEIIEYIEAGLRKYSDEYRTNALLQMAGGDYDFDLKTKKVKSVNVASKEIDLNKVYTVIVPKYIALGGDSFPKKEIYETLKNTANVYLKQNLKNLSK
ncbi:MAG: bifunctional metallophosphatase/5'-nucleotidase [Alphaproteobacteria bacterium]|nr:bifunctional metallophosphatase/5'-nucleotidase [Alphaproteobacteria bacterium]